MLVVWWVQDITCFSKWCLLKNQLHFGKSYYNACFPSVLLKGKEGDQIDEVKILNAIQLLRQLCKILPQKSHKRIQASWVCFTVTAPTHQHLTCSLAADTDSSRGKARSVLVMAMVLGNNISLLC